MGAVVTHIRERGVGLALLPALPRLLTVVVAILWLQWTTDPLKVVEGCVLSCMVLILNLRIRLKFLIFTSAAITFVSIFAGNILFPPVPCSINLPPLYQLGPVEAIFGKCGFDAGLVLSVRRVAMLVFGFAWLNATRLSEMASLAAMPFRQESRYPIRALVTSPFSIARRLTAEYALGTKSLAIRIGGKKGGRVDRFLRGIFVTYLKLSAAILRLFANTPKAAFAIAMHGAGRRSNEGAVELRVSRFGVGYDSRWVLQNVDLFAKSGDVIFLAGAPESGKTTFLRALTRYIPQIEGKIAGELTVNGKSWTNPDLSLVDTLPSQRALSSDAYEFFIGVTVGQEMRFHASRKRARYALALMGLSEAWSRDIETLSGGERVRVALACILASRSKFLVLDNPLSQLDAAGRRTFCAALGDYIRSEKPLVFITDRYATDFAALVTRCIELKDGNATEVTTDRLFQATASEAGDVTRLRAVRRHASRRVLAQLNDAEVRIGARSIFRHLNFEVCEGEVVTIVGPNGSGKTTAMLALAGTIPLNAGSVTGSEDVGLSFQNPSLQFVCQRSLDELNLKARLRGGTKRNKLAHEQQELKWLSFAMDTEVLDLGSKGQRKLSISSMLYDTRVLIVDEPDNELIGQNLIDLLQRINDLCGRGVGVVVISHSPMLEPFADRIVDFTGYAHNV